MGRFQPTQGRVLSETEHFVGMFGKRRFRQVEANHAELSVPTVLCGPWCPGRELGVPAVLCGPWCPGRELGVPAVLCGPWCPGQELGVLSFLPEQPQKQVLLPHPLDSSITGPGLSTQGLSWIQAACPRLKPVPKSHLRGVSQTREHSSGHLSTPRLQGLWQLGAGRALRRAE